MTKRRIIWIAVGVLVLGAAGAGVAWYYRQNTGAKLLRRAELALSADKPDKALNLARKYVGQRPDHWRGYYVAALALAVQGRQEEARAQLAEAAHRSPKEAAIGLASADTYARPAAQMLSLPANREKTSAMKEVAAGLHKANEVLEAFQASDDAGALKIRLAIGSNYRRLSRSQGIHAELLEREIRIAEASRAEEQVQAKRKEREEVLADAAESLRKAIAALLAVVRKDPAAPGAAEALVEMCIEAGDTASLEVARKAVESAPSPPPVAAMLLAVHDMHAGASGTQADKARRIAKTAERLDELLAKSPNDVRLKLARAELAMAAADPARAKKLSAEILAAEPRNSGAGLLHARALMADANWGQAEGELYTLCSQFPHWHQAHYWYALAAEATGKSELAREAMRKVTQLRPDHPQARKYLAKLLLAEFPDQAFDDAKACYQADPNDAESLLLFVEAAGRTDQPVQARAALEATFQRAAGKPILLMAVADGYLSLRDGQASRKAAAAAAELAPATDAERMAVAEALIRLDRTAEADKLLYEAVRTDPNSAQSQFALARRFEASARDLQAREHYRKAVELDKRNPSYRMALAGSLINSRELEEAADVLKPILTTSEAARELMLQVRILEGPGGAEASPQDSAERPAAGLARAEAYFRTGRLEDCIKTCTAELERGGENLGFRVLLGQAYLLKNDPNKCREVWSPVVTARPTRLPIYASLAALMAGQGSLEDANKAAKALIAVPGARQDMVDLAIAGLHRQRGQFLQAAALYAKVAASAGSAEGTRYQAALEHAAALAMGGKADEAVAAIEALLAGNVQPLTTLQAKVELLSALRRAPDAEAALKQLVSKGLETRNDRAVRGAVANALRLGKGDLALLACDALDNLAPRDPRTYLARVDALTVMGRYGDVPALYEKAIQLQPTELRLYVAMSDVQDALRRPTAALDTARRMEQLGQAGLFLSAFQQAALYARWGLTIEAGRRLEGLADKAATPTQLLMLGRAMLDLKRNVEAKAALVKVPQYTQAYLDARLLLADLADTLPQKQAILGELMTTAAAPAALEKEIVLLLEAGKASEAAAAFRARLGGKPFGRAFAAPARRAFTAAVVAGDLAEARRLAVQIAGIQGDPRWRGTALLIALDAEPAAVEPALPKPQEADYVQAMLGLAHARQSGKADALKPWAERLAAIEKEWSQLQPPQSAPAAGKVLAALAAADEAAAKAAMEHLKGGGDRGDPAPARADAAAELLDAAAGGPLHPQELARLLKAQIALGLAQPDVAVYHALAAFEARPACQWAALIAVDAGPTGPQFARIVAAIQPQDCFVARLLKTKKLQLDGKYTESAEEYGKLIKDRPDHPGLMLECGMAQEQIGNLPEALRLYRAVWDKTKDPRAGNNWAYVTCQVSPKDEKKLAEARKLSDEAIQALRIAPFLDTAGWIAHLQGRVSDACLHLRDAIRGQRDSAEVHYHLGRAEAAAGNNALARMHMAEAVRIGELLAERARAKGTRIPPNEKAGAEAAKAALLEIAPPNE